MHCAYALLFFPEESMRHQERLVVFGKQYPSSHYSIHKPQFSGQFPEINLEHEIIKTKWQINGPGTYLRAYCSFTLPALEIAQKITDDLENLLNKTQNDFGPTDGSDERCFEHITRLQNERSTVHKYNYNCDLKEAPIIKISSLRKKLACTDLAIVTLVHRGQITTTGKYNFDAPPNRFGLPSIEFDKPVHMEGVVSENQFFEGTYNQIGFYALAWFQGHLHVFLRKHRDTKWLLETDVVQVNRNGAIISAVLFGYFRLPREFNSLINSIPTNVNKRSSGLASFCRPWVDTKECRATEAIKNFDLKMLQTTTPVGILGLH